jgi:hypothetical protein
LPDLDDVARSEAKGHNLACDRGRELDERFVGLHLDQGLVPGDRVARSDQPRDDLALLEALADVGEGELDAPH